MKRILITGAGGFWGKHLAPYLLKQDYSVVGTYHKVKHPEIKGVSWRRLDVTNEDEVASLIRALRPNAVCHLAGQSSLSLSWKIPEKTFSLNTLSTVYFLSAIRRFSPSTRFVLTSSIHVYGYAFSKGNLLNESHYAWPEGPYGVSKRTAEFACLDSFQRYGVQTVAIRPVNCIGAGLGEHFAFSDWSKQIAAAEHGAKKIDLKVGNLDVKRDFLHIDDAVRAYEFVMRKGKAGEIYNLSSGKVIPIRKYAEALAKLAKIPVKIKVDKKRFRLLDPLATRVSSSKLQKLGWKPEKTAFLALDELLSKWREHYG